MSDVDSHEFGPAIRGGFQADNSFDECAFSTAGFPHDADGGPFSYLQGDAVNSFDILIFPIPTRRFKEDTCCS